MQCTSNMLAKSLKRPASLAVYQVSRCLSWHLRPLAIQTFTKHGDGSTRPRRTMSTRGRIVDKKDSLPTRNGATATKALLSDDCSIEDLLARNKAWSQKMAEEAPGFFPSLTHTQQPKILWIGCSDSRVPETTVMDLMPGEVFVTRNIANVVANSDMSMLSVVQFAVEVLQVRHIIINGHYGCGGVNAALTNKKLGLIDNWLRHVRDVRAQHLEELEALGSEAEKSARLVELNVLHQVKRIERISYVAEAILTRGLEVHPMVYDVASGRLKKLNKLEDKEQDCYISA